MENPRLFTHETSGTQPGGITNEQWDFSCTKNRLKSNESPYRISPMDTLSFTPTGRNENHEIPIKTPIEVSTEQIETRSSSSPMNSIDVDGDTVVVEMTKKEEIQNDTDVCNQTSTINIDTNRRKRRKPLTPPQKFNLKQPCFRSEHMHHPSFDSEAVTASPTDDLPITCEQVSKASPSSSMLHDGGDGEVRTKVTSQNPEERDFIQDLSRRAVTTFRQSLSQIKHDHDDTMEIDDCRIEQVIGKTLQHLEPQIARLVGQTLKSSLSSLRESMMKNAGRQLLGDTMADGLVSSGMQGDKKDASLFQLNHGVMDSIRRLPTVNKITPVNSSVDLTESPFSIGRLTLPVIQSKEANDLEIVDSSRMQSNRGCLKSKRNTPPTISEHHSPSSGWFGEGEGQHESMPTSPDVLETSLKSGTDQQSQLTLGMELGDVGSGAKGAYYVRKFINRDGESHTGNMVDNLSRKVVEKCGTEPIINHCHPEAKVERPLPNPSLAFSTALELLNPILANRMQDAEHLMTKFSSHPMLQPWNLPLSTDSSNSRHNCPTLPLGFLPPLPGTTFPIPIPTPFDRINNMLNPEHVLQSHMISEEEQTEALPLIVPRRPQSKSANGGENFGTVQNHHSSITPTNSSMNGTFEDSMLNQGFHCSRRRRTKVTDTRLSTRHAPGRPQHDYMSPRLSGAHTLPEFDSVSIMNSLADRKQTSSRLPAYQHPLFCQPNNVPPVDSIGRFNSGFGDVDSSHPLLSPPMSHDIRINSSCSSPSPSSVRLSNGHRDGGAMEGEFNATSVERLTNYSMGNFAGLTSNATLSSSSLSTASTMAQNKMYASNMGLNFRKSENWTRREQNRMLSRQCDSFENVLAKTLRQTPQALRQGASLLGPMMNAIGSVEMSCGNVASGAAYSFNNLHSNGNPMQSLSARLSSKVEHALQTGQSTSQHMERQSYSGQSMFRREVQSELSSNKRDMVHSIMSSVPSYLDRENVAVKERNSVQLSPDGMNMTTTLTPVHLRKAKLMFFFTRYPNSTLIKMYFPDVKFYKNNTAQLVKWFSNFREFYYIQMEKFARVSISEGVRNADDIRVTADSELYRALSLHYNRNQQLDVPDHFRVVVEATLKEFFNALLTGKDVEQSWKKPIYKIIARMDQPVPDFFKNHNWMNQLADG